MLAQWAISKSVKIDNHRKVSRLASGSLPQKRANRFRVGEQRITSKSQALDRTVASFLVARSACVAHKYRNVTKVGTVTDGWLDPDFRGDADDDEGVDPAIPQSEVEPCAFESRHR